jgi:hypothetical protein
MAELGDEGEGGTTTSDPVWSSCSV